MRHRRTRTSTGRSAWRPCMPSMPAISWQNEVMDANRIPEDVAAAIEECWPDGVVEEFDTDESYFCDIHAKLERDLRKIPGASLLWQTPMKVNSGRSNRRAASPKARWSPLPSRFPGQFQFRSY